MSRVDKIDVAAAVLMLMVSLFILYTVVFCTPTSRADAVNLSLERSVVILHNADGHGSGVVIGSREVLTAKHVAMVPELTVLTHDGKEYQIVSTVQDPNSDLAIVTVDQDFDVPPLILDATPLRVGDRVTIIGTPYSIWLQNCVLPGLVVKVDADFPSGKFPIPETNLDVVDCHADIGCSGSPVIDSQGRVRGIAVLLVGRLCGAVPIEELDR
jgi:S1-C subfamily serine protease